VSSAVEVNGLPGLGDRSRRAGKAAAIRSVSVGAVVALEVGLAVALATSHVGAAVVAVLALAALAVLACVLAPWPTLLALAAVWAPAHTILADFHVADVHQFELTLSRMLGVFILLGFGCYLIVSGREERPSLPRPLRALVAFVVLFTLATAISSSANGVADLIRVASGVVIALVAYRTVNSLERLLRLSTLVIVGGVVVALVTIAEFALLRVDPGLAHSLFGESFFARSYDYRDAAASAVRVFGPLGGAGETSGALLVAFVFGLLRYSLLRDRGLQTRNVLALVVIAAGLVATLTRAATVALLVLLLIWVLQRQLRSVSPVALRTRLVVLVAGLALLTLPILGAREIQSRFADVNPGSSGQAFAQGRGEIWTKELALVRGAGPLGLLLGLGAHSSYVSVPQPEDPAAVQSPHNLLLWLVIETGLLGTITYLVFVAGTGRRFFAVARLGRYTPRGQIAAVGLAGLAAYTVMDLFLLTVPSPGHRWYFMLFIGAGLRLCGPGVNEAARAA
jgi:O-antigen ligase